MNGLLDVVAGVLILSGSSIVAIAGLGLVRLPDPLMRMHAATKAGVVGSGLVMVGVGLSLDSVSAIVIGLLGLTFLLATSPIASHALGRAAYVSGAPVAPSTAVDALAGVLPRANVEFGQLAHNPPNLEHAGVSTMTMTDVNVYTRSDDAQVNQTLRLVTVWLIGGEAQPDATLASIDLAKESGAQLAGLSALDFASTNPPGPYPIGGLSWARWLGNQRRLRMRDRAAHAIADFEEATQASGLTASIRHEELDLVRLMPIVAGTDLVVVPAGIDEIGETADGPNELAAKLSAMRFVPVLRVRRRQLAVRRVAVVVSNSPNCGRLAQALLRSRLWHDAAISIIPIGGHRADVLRLVNEQRTLLGVHRYKVTIESEIDLDADRETIEGRLRPFEVAVLGVLSNRRGWFGAVREDIHELASAHVPMVLLP